MKWSSEEKQELRWLMRFNKPEIQLSLIRSSASALNRKAGSVAAMCVLLHIYIIVDQKAMESRLLRMHRLGL